MNSQIPVLGQICCGKLQKNVVESSITLSNTKFPDSQAKLLSLRGSQYVLLTIQKPVRKSSLSSFADLISGSGCSSPSLWIYDLSLIVLDIKEYSELNLLCTTVVGQPLLLGRAFFIEQSVNCNSNEYLITFLSCCFFSLSLSLPVPFSPHTQQKK